MGGNHDEILISLDAAWLIQSVSRDIISLQTAAIPLLVLSSLFNPVLRKRNLWVF